MTSTDSISNSPQESRRLLVSAVWVRRLAQVLLGLTLVAGVCLPMAGFRGWGLLTWGLLLTWQIWMAERIIWRHSRMPGHGLQWALLAMGLLLAGRMLQQQYGGPEEHKTAVGLTISLLTHLGLVSLGVLLVESLFAAKSTLWIVSRVLAGAVLLGGGVATMSHPESVGATGFWMVGMAGVLLAVAGLPWPRVEDCERRGPARLRVDRWVLLGGGGALLVILAIPLLLRIPGDRLLLLRMAALLGWLGLGAGLAPLPGRLLRWGVGVLWAGGVAGILLLPAMRTVAELPWLGLAGDAFVRLDPTGGLFFLVEVFGLFPVVVLFFFAACMAWAALASKTTGWPGRFWTGGALLGLVAWTLPGLYDSPLATTALLVGWGLLPRMTGLTVRPRPAWILGLATLGLMVLIDIAADPGLLADLAARHGLDDKFMHGVAGFLVAMVLAWVLGSKRWWLGLIALVIGVAAGAAGEIAQKLFTLRNPELLDFRAHTIGVAVGLGVYLACLLCRWAEQITGTASYRKRVWKYRIGLLTRGGLTLLFVLAGFLWLFVALLEISGGDGAGTRGEMILAEGLYVSPYSWERAQWIPGICTLPLAGQMTLHYTINAGGELDRAWKRSHENIAAVFARNSQHPPGRNSVSIVGLPYGELSGVRAAGFWTGVPVGEAIYLVDPLLFLDETGALPSRPDAAQVEVLSRPNTAVLGDLPLDKVSLLRNWVRLAEPVPVLQNPRYPGSLRHALQQCLHQPDQQPDSFRVHVLTPDRNRGETIRKHFGRYARVHWITIDPATPSDSLWLHRVPSLEAYLDETAGASR